MNSTYILIENIIKNIINKDKKLGNKLLSHFSRNNPSDYLPFKSFLKKYQDYLISSGHDINYSIDCHIETQEMILKQREFFLETGEYYYKNIDDVKKYVYDNPQKMNKYLHGLILGQFLWPEQMHRFKFFCNNINNYTSSINNCLEIGAGHGIYAECLLTQTEKSFDFTIIDISKSSIELSKLILRNYDVSYINKDINDYITDNKYDFITLCEVVEHSDDPSIILSKAYNLLHDEGIIYFSTPANSPMIDHLHLFNNIDEIKNMIEENGFKILNETSMFADDVPPEIGERFKISQMYSAFLKKL